MKAFRGKRILEQIANEPESNYEEYAAKWADMGNPSYMHPHQVASRPRHLLVLGQRYSQIRDRSRSRRLERLR